jgi:sugar/nucleoside kinase (ribokinase family)/nucleoside 2-deoxyribosyltransferase
MLHIAGGTYLEYCAEPYWSQFFGSGGRAAAALQRLSSGVALSTYVSDDQLSKLALLAATYGFDTSATKSAQAISFSYYHALASPTIDPPIDRIVPAAPLRIDAEHILRFGFLEGTCVVSGERVVFDPQSEQSPEVFAANGSTAAHLAIVANLEEATTLSGTHDLAEIGRVLIREHGAEVAIVKRGAVGASIFTIDRSEFIPAYRTDVVFPIGSGDVFSATFAHYWAEEGADPFVAAERASLATAYYCSRFPLPIPPEPLSVADFSAVPVVQAAPAQHGERPRVYLAGPFFTMAQRWLIDEAREALLDQGLAVFSPLHDVGYGIASEVGPADIRALEGCAAVLALLDGLDAGTLVEVGYARARDIPVVGFSQNERREDLTMVEGTDCEVVDNFASAIYRTAWAALSQ